MTGSPGFLEFFILEASDYVEQIDALLLGGGTSGPDAEALQRVARALRGTATMARLTPFAELAGAVERVARAVQERRLAWDAAVGGAATAAVDDLKSLLHSARNWTPTETERAATRVAELSRFAPRPAPTPTAAAAQAAGAPFLSTEAANIAAGLELLRARPSDADNAGNVLRRVRALRGVAGVKEIAPLAEVLEASEDCTRRLELHAEPLSADARALLESAAALLNHLSASLRDGRDARTDSPEYLAFRAALETWQEHENERERIVPIETLFDHAASGVVEAAAHPPTSVAERFRLELTSQGEHLRGVIAAARGGADPVRSRRELRRAVRGLQALTESFGQRDIAEAIGAHADTADHVDVLGLNVMDELAALVTQPNIDAATLRARLRELSAPREQAAEIASGLGPVPGTQAPMAPAPAPPAPPAPPTPAPSAPAPVSPAPMSPSPTALPDLLDSSIAALGALNASPLAAPTALAEENLVPIDELLYRGRTALDRAIELREDLRRAGPQLPRESLDELFDLLDLARAE